MLYIQQGALPMEVSMTKLIPARTSMLTEFIQACRIGTGRLVASFGAGLVMAPVLFIALMPLAILAILLLPPVGMWLAVSSMFGDSSL